MKTADNKIIEEYKGFLLVYKSDSIRYEKTDARRSKDYHITVSWAVTILDTTPERTGYDESENRAIGCHWEGRHDDHPLRRLPGTPTITSMNDWEEAPDSVRDKFDPNKLMGRDRNTVRAVRVRTTWKLTYDRPKDMPANPGEHPFATQQAVEAVCDAYGYTCRDDLQSRVLAGIRQMLADRVDSLTAQKRAADAAWMACWIGKEADTRARAIVRFEQRLAALVAELEAEHKVQVAKVVEETKADPTYEDEAGVKHTLDDRVLKAAIKHVKIPAIFPSFLSSDNFKVPVEDVT